MHSGCSPAQLWWLKFKKLPRHLPVQTSRCPPPIHNLTNFLISPRPSVNKTGRSHNRWMLIMLMKYWHNILTHTICCDKKVPRARACECEHKENTKQCVCACVMQSVCMCVCIYVWGVIRCLATIGTNTCCYESHTRIQPPTHFLTCHICMQVNTQRTHTHTRSKCRTI